MSKTRIFVSSTCFDLAQVRDDLCHAIIDLGHQAVMSELASFPVISELSAVENCRRNVRENSDMFLLIVGGRHGSIDESSGKSIVNIEFETAVQCGLDIFVFVYEPILTLLPAWENNPEANFAPSVDSSAVFAFVKRLRESQRWIYSFKRASEISDTLKTQLSAFLKYLLDRKHANTLDALPEFANETKLANSLALDRPPLWEHRLTAELLRQRMIELRQLLSDLDRGLLVRSNRRVDTATFMNWMDGKFEDLSALVEMIRLTVVEEIPHSWGPPGVSGEPVKILEAVRKLYAGCSALVQWENDVLSVHPPEECSEVKQALRGSATDIFHQVEPLSAELDRIVGVAMNHGGTEPLQFSIALNFEFPRSKTIVSAIDKMRFMLGLSSS